MESESGERERLEGEWRERERERERDSERVEIDWREGGQTISRPRHRPADATASGKLICASVVIDRSNIFIMIYYDKCALPCHCTQILHVIV